MQHHSGSHAESIVHTFGQPLIQNRLHTVFKNVGIHLAPTHPGIFRPTGVPGFAFDFGKQVAGIGKCRHPGGTVAARIPAHVIDMQVGAHDNVDLSGIDTGLSESLQKSGLQTAKYRNAGSILVVARPGVNEDLQTVSINQPTLQESVDIAILQIIRHKLMLYLIKDLLLKLCKKCFRGRKLTRPLLDSPNRITTYVKRWLHGALLLPQR